MSKTDFNDLLVQNSDYLKPFAFNLAKDNEVAKDLIQETLYKALANREKYCVGTNVKAWMYTIMRNIFINNYRRRSRHQVIFDSTTNDFLIDSIQPSIPDSIEASLQLKEIKLRIHRLPGIFRHPFELYFEGYKYKEIAGFLKEPLGTIKSRIHFARKMLKEEISRF